MSSIPHRFASPPVTRDSPPRQHTKYLQRSHNTTVAPGVSQDTNLDTILQLVSPVLIVLGDLESRAALCAAHHHHHRQRHSNGKAETGSLYSISQLLFPLRPALFIREERRGEERREEEKRGEWIQEQSYQNGMHLRYADKSLGASPNFIAVVVYTVVPVVDIIPTYIRSPTQQCSMRAYLTT